jgi:bifunctional UDP-N-acetylglucosamine pyrophosphorylase / glucosamine-1-phosphate N-acetyltransferase
MVAFKLSPITLSSLIIGATLKLGSNMSVEVIILAAGKGSRMRSKLPKVMHTLAGVPMIAHVVNSTKPLQAKTNIVVGHESEKIVEYFAQQTVYFAQQTQQLGTGHAVLQALPLIDPTSTVLVLYGDVPLIQTATLEQLLKLSSKKSMGLLTITLDDSQGYGRIVRDQHQAVTAIVEHKDCTVQQLQIKEVNTGIMAVQAEFLQQCLPNISSDNAQKEYYLTDIIAMAVAEGLTVNTLQPQQVQETFGVNDRQQLAYLERWQQLQLTHQLMQKGASLADPARVDIRGSLTTGEDVFIDVNTLFTGEVSLGDNVIIGPNCHLNNVSIAAGTQVFANSVLEEAVIGEDCLIGPFARVRPGTVLKNRAKLGNFVETKKAVIGEGSKVNHLSYIGDSVLGEGVNIGAGTITCNYDGVNKYATQIEDGAFVGSNSTLIAPVTIERQAFVGAGSIISKTAAADKLTLARTRQKTIESWQKPAKNK